MGRRSHQLCNAAILTDPRLGRLMMAQDINAKR
jgi:hypothetical protein